MVIGVRSPTTRHASAEAPHNQQTVLLYEFIFTRGSLLALSRFISKWSQIGTATIRKIAIRCFAMVVSITLTIYGVNPQPYSTIILLRSAHVDGHFPNGAQPCAELRRSLTYFRRSASA